MNPNWEIWLLALLLWREARNQQPDAITAVACSVRNRVLSPRWWGTTWTDVILCPEQYSSFNAGDPNATKFPTSTDSVIGTCYSIASAVYNGAADTVDGAQSYFDLSLADDPPSWAESMTFVCQVGAFKFYRV